MNLEYALVTSAVLPDQVKGSVNYVSLDRAQWMDLVDYSEDLVHDRPRSASFIVNLCPRNSRSGRGR